MIIEKGSIQEVVGLEPLQIVLVSFSGLLESKSLGQSATLTGTLSGSIVFGWLNIRVVTAQRRYSEDAIAGSWQKFVGYLPRTKILRAAGKMLVYIAVAVSHLLNEFGCYIEMVANLLLVTSMASLKILQALLKFRYFGGICVHPAGQHKTNGNTGCQTNNSSQPQHNESLPLIGKPMQTRAR